jgi:rod shape-determining protein MreB
MTRSPRTGVMRRHGAWSWGRPSLGVAIDLGSARTRVWIPTQGLVADTPTLASSPAEGISHPVRRGSIVDVDGAARLLHRLVHGHRNGTAPLGTVVLTVPALHTAADRDAAMAAVQLLEPRNVLTIETAKAAAIGANADFVAPLLVVDIGAHLIEVAVLWDGTVVAASSTLLGTSDLTGCVTTGDLVQAVLDMVTDLLHSDCAPQVVDALDTGPLLTGGGTLQPAIVYQLSKRLASPVRPVPMPHTAAVRGAARAVLAAHRHPGA